MPYIRKSEREKFQPILDSYKELLESGHITVGELNYLITRLIDITIYDSVVMEPDGRMTYKILNSIMGVLECVKLELYRRVIVPFECSKQEINGDVFVTDVRNKD